MTESLAIIETNESAALAILDDPRHGQAALAYLANLSPGSRRTMTQSLAAIADTLLDRPAARSTEENARRVAGFKWGALRAEHVSAIRARLIDACAPGPDGAAPSLSVATANKGLVALRKVLFESWKAGLIEREDYERAIAFERIAGTSPKKGRGLTAKEVLKLAMSCEEDATPLGARDGALLALLLFAGLRRFELAGLKVSDWNAEDAEVTVRYGKGLKTRVVPVPEGVAVALDRWLSVRREILAAGGVETDSLLFGLTRGHKARAESLTTDAIFKALLQRAKRAGVASFTPHDLRRTYIGDLLDAGADLSTAQQLAGHADPKTTASYDRRGAAVRQAAARKLHAPFSKRIG